MAPILQGYGKYRSVGFGRRPSWRVGAICRKMFVLSYDELRLFFFPAIATKQDLNLNLNFPGGDVPVLYTPTNGPASVPLPQQVSTGQYTCSTNNQGECERFRPRSGKVVGLFFSARGEGACLSSRGFPNTVINKYSRAQT